MSENVLARECRCGHSAGAHNLHGSGRYWKDGSNWHCFSPGCQCQMYQTHEEWAAGMMERLTSEPA